MSGLFGMGASSSSSTTTQAPTDPEAAKRMAAVAERQQEMAEEQWGLGKDIYMPYEKAMVESNVALLGPNEELMRKRLEEGTYDITQDRERRDLIRSQMTQELKTSAGVPTKFYEETLKAGDPNERMATASADVEQAFAGAEGETRRSMGRMGINPASGRFASLRGETLRKKASTLAGARTGARKSASDDLYSRLTTAMGARTGLQAGSIDTAPYQQGELSLGGYQLSNPMAQSAGIYSNVINANAAGMKPLTQGQSKSSSWNFSISSERYKEDIEPLNVGNKIDALRAVTFKYKDEINIPGKHIGFIAEELIEVLPEVVVKNERGFAEGINYSEIIPLLAGELKSLRKRVKELEVR